MGNHWKGIGSQPDPGHVPSEISPIVCLVGLLQSTSETGLCWGWLPDISAENGEIYIYISQNHVFLGLKTTELATPAEEMEQLST